MTDETALLAAAQADPMARLVYADCLDEQGKPLDAALQRVLAEPHEDRHRLDYAAACERNGDASRAEFIRVQCELARPPDGSPNHRENRDPKCGCVYCCLLVRERELWRDTRGSEWYSDLGMAVTIGESVSEAATRAGLRVAFLSRGFVDRLTVSAEEWLQKGDAIRARHPVTAVRLTTWPEHMSQFNRERYHLFLEDRWPGVNFTLPA